jgi:ParB family chromosome partitioning protein
MKEKKSILGRGLDELFESKIETLAPRELAIAQIVPGDSQPRKHFDPEKISQLSASIRDTGLIQPIVVRPSSEDNIYEIIAGERRWLAAKEAGLETVPVIIKSIPDREALKLAIIENVQREDLNVLEEAEAYHRLINEHKYSQDMVATEVGKSRSHVANTLRLLNLPDEIKEFLVNGQMSAGHARALLNDENSIETARDIIHNNLNVREVERRVKKKKGKGTSGKPMGDEENITQRIAGLLNAKVAVSIKKNTIHVGLEFQDPWDLEDFINALSARDQA